MFKTAVAEVRPWLKESVSVGYFEITKDLNFVNTAKDKHKIYVYIGEGKPNLSCGKKEKIIWGDTNYSFSKPVALGETYRDYIPTQYLSECFKAEGYDGIIYKSALTKKGYNVVLFSTKFASLKFARSFCIKNLEYKFEQDSNPYQVKT